MKIFAWSQMHGALSNDWALFAITIKIHQQILRFFKMWLIWTEPKSYVWENRKICWWILTVIAKSAQSFDRAPCICDHAKIFIQKYKKSRKINQKKVVRSPMEIDHFVASYVSCTSSENPPNPGHGFEDFAWNFDRIDEMSQMLIRPLWMSIVDT